MLKCEFPSFKRVERPIIKTEIIPDPNWIAGFVSGEGNFDVPITQSSKNTARYQVRLRFRVTQHERDIFLMENIIRYLGVGKIYKYPNQPAVRIEVSNFKDLTNVIIPFF